MKAGIAIVSLLIFIPSVAFCAGVAPYTEEEKKKIETVMRSIGKPDIKNHKRA